MYVGVLCGVWATCRTHDCVNCVRGVRDEHTSPAGAEAWRAERRSREHSRRSGAANHSIYMVQSGRDADDEWRGESRSPAYSLRFGIANSYFRAVNFADSRFEYLKMEIGAVSTFEIEFCTKGKLAPNESECVENAPTTLQN